MDICPTCHANGRSLWLSCCLCVEGGALKPSDFHAWNAKRRIPFNLPKQKVAIVKPVAKRPKLVFGQAIPK